MPAICSLPDNDTKHFWKSEIVYENHFWKSVSIHGVAISHQYPYLCPMKRLLILLTVLLVAVSASAQVGRFKNIRVFYPGYSLKLDTSTGELSAVHYDTDQDATLEAVISPKQSRNQHQIGRYEFRRTRQLGTYQIFDTATGKYTTVKWKPVDKDGREIDERIDTAISSGIEKIRKAFKSLEESLEGI